MIIRRGRSYQEVIDILLSESQSLKTLAYLSGYDPFIFYRSANLRGLDLSGQDLTKLNFDNADLRGADLRGASYDIGAFNNSFLSDSSTVAVDEFDCYLEDVLVEDIKRLYLFVRIRVGTIEKVTSDYDMTYADFAEKARISVATLRKARRAEAVAIETAQALAHAVRELATARGVSESFIKQPSIAFLAINPVGGFRILTREDYHRYLDTASRLYEFRRSTRDSWPPYMESWRDGPTMLEWYAKHFFGDHDERGEVHGEAVPSLPLDFGLFSGQAGEEPDRGKQ